MWLNFDVLLLACMSKTFRNKSINLFVSYSAHYLSTPDCSLDAVQKLILDIESTIRGGISMICKRYAKPNNKFLKSYNTYKNTSYIEYVDVNNLYGHSMMHLLPTGILV